jgi:hypothetical protein
MQSSRMLVCRRRGGPMSERTFRAVVAAVLVGALALAAVVVFVGLSSPSPSPAPTAVRTATPRPTPVATSTPTPGPVFGEVQVSAVGSIPRGGTSPTSFALHAIESRKDAIAAAPGSFTLTLTDSSGAGTTLALTGTPSVDAPGWMGVKAEVVGGNTLRISVAMSDLTLLEQFTVSGLGIRATPGAALGPISATLEDFTGSLAGGVAKRVLASPGTIVAGP